MRVSKKIILTILSLSLFVFSVSCSNEKTTGGGGGVPPASPEVPDGGGGEESPDTPFEAVEKSGNQKDITIKSADGSSVNETTGKIEFTVTGASDYTVNITKVDKGSSPVDFVTSDFEYNKTSKELKLSSDGLIKFENSKDQFTEEAKNGYTITFEVADSSDQNRKKDVNVQINLIKAKTEIAFDAVEKSGNQKDITIKSADGSSVNETTGKIEFTVTGASDYTVNITKVDKGSSPVDFDVSDFEYNKANGELKLSSAGLIKFENSKDQFTEEAKNGYTITFEVADSSDQNRKKDVNVQINLIKAKADTPSENGRRKW